MNINEIFGLNVKQIRTNKKISQEKLAFTAGIDRTYISDIEKGTRNVSLTIAKKIADALNIQLKELL